MTYLSEASLPQQLPAQKTGQGRRYLRRLNMWGKLIGVKLKIEVSVKWRAFTFNEVSDKERNETREPKTGERGAKWVGQL